MKPSSSNILLISGCLIEKDKKILLVQEAKKHCYGSWNFAQGRLLKANLNIVENAIKETKEETGYDVKIDGLIGIYEYISGRGTNVVAFLFKAHIIGGDGKFNKKEILNTKWFSLEEIQELKKDNKLRWPMMENVAKDCLSGTLHKIENIIQFGN